MTQMTHHWRTESVPAIPEKPLFVLVVVFVAGTLLAAPFEITRTTIDGGGAMRSIGGAFELSGTIGQPDAGKMTGESFELNGGFWFELEEGDCDEDGGIGLADFGAMSDCLLGPNATVNDACRCFDLNGSGTVDLVDFAFLQTLHIGD